VPRPGFARFIAYALTAGAVFWVTALVAAAALKGNGPLAWIYQFASAVCHQRPERSFAIDGSQLPVCARCAALYASGALGAMAAWIGFRRPPRFSRELLLFAALPTILTIPIEWLGLSPLSNGIRASAALPLGGAAGWTFVRALRAESEAAEGFHHRENRVNRDK
jgi:uncharacterized membrane protein